MSDFPALGSLEVAVTEGELPALRELAVILARRVESPGLEPRAPLAAQLRATLERIAVLAPPVAEESGLDRIRAVRLA